MTNFAETMRPFVYRLEVHQPYLVHLEQVTKELDGIVQDHENKFGQFIRSQSTSPECGNMGLASFLLKPMQRLTKYPLFFKVGLENQDQRKGNLLNYSKYGS